MAQLAMDGADLGIRRNTPAADGPDRFIGNDGVFGGSALRQAPHELRRHDVDRSSGFPLGFGFANADNRSKPGSQGCRGLVLDDRIGFAMSGAAFGVTDYDEAAALVRQHFCADIACMGATLCPMAVLSAELQPGCPRSQGGSPPAALRADKSGYPFPEARHPCSRQRDRRPVSAHPPGVHSSSSCPQQAGEAAILPLARSTPIWNLRPPNTPYEVKPASRPRGAGTRLPVCPCETMMPRGRNPWVVSQIHHSCSLIASFRRC